MLTAPGKIKIDDNEYEVNDDFKQQTLELADALNLDELDAAALFLGAESEAQELDRSQLQTAVIRFHRRREYVLLCVRILIKTALDNGDSEVEGLPVLQEAAQMLNAHRRTVTPAHLTGPYLPQPRHPIFLCPSPHRALTPLGFCTLRAFWGHDA